MMKHILLVEDNLGDAKLAQMMLVEAPDFEAQITCAGRLSDVAKILSHEATDLVLLDLSLPDAQGLDGVRKLLPLAKEAPIVVLSGTNNKRKALDALKCGAQDYGRSDLSKIGRGDCGQDVGCVHQAHFDRGGIHRHRHQYRCRGIFQRWVHKRYPDSSCRPGSLGGQVRRRTADVLVRSRSTVFLAWPA